MVKNDVESVVLTEEEQKKIVLVQGRLKVLQDEVLIATKNLAGIESAIAQAAEDKVFYDNLITSLKPQVDSLQKRKESLELEVAQGETALRSHEERHGSLNEEFATKSVAHDAREGSLAKRESEHSSNAEELSRDRNILMQKEQKLEKVRIGIMKAFELMG